MFEETHVVVGCETNRAFDEQISLDTFFELSHIVVLLGPSRLPSFAYENLIELGHLRKIDVYAPLFSAVPWMLIGTNRISVLQERLARTFCVNLADQDSATTHEFSIDARNDAVPLGTRH